MQLAELCSPQPLIGFNHQTGWRAVVMNVSNYDAKALRRHLRRAVAMIYRPKCAKKATMGTRGVTLCGLFVPASTQQLDNPQAPREQPKWQTRKRLAK